MNIALMLESDGPGGAETMLLQLAEGLRDRGHAVRPVGPENGSGWLAARFRERGFQPETFHLRFPVDPICLYGMVRLLRRLRVDVVHSHEFTMAVYGAAAAMILRRPHLITMHGGTGYGLRWRRRAALGWAVGRSAVAVAVSDSTRRSLLGSLRVEPREVVVVPNGIRPTKGDGARARNRLGLEQSEVLVLSVGNLYPVKGYRVLLEAASYADRETSISWRVAIAGRGGQGTALESLARELGIEQRVQFLGFRDDVPDLLAAADVFAMPSLSEGLPLALLEAMFAGKAILASRVGGIPEALQGEGDSILVPPGDAPALAKALGRLLSDAELRRKLGRSAREKALARFDSDRMVDRYEELYRRAAELAGPADGAVMSAD